jgi:hypothetical protein
VLELRRGRAGRQEFSGGWLGARLVAREEEEREEKRGRLWSGFYSVAQCGREGERRRTAGHRPTALLPCPVGHPRPHGGLGTGGSTWRGGGEPTGAARVAGGLARSHVGWRRAARGRRAARKTAGEVAGSRARNRAGGLEVEDKGRYVIFQKYKDFTLKLR